MVKYNQSKHLLNYVIISCLVLFVLFSAGCASTKNINNDSPFFFVQLSDPQIGFYADSIKQEIASYEKAVADVNQLRPDFVVITGDLVNNARDKEQLAEFKRITAMINPSIPVYYTPGNHDVGNNPTTDDLNFYNSIYGYDHFAFEHKGSFFIGYNSSLIRASLPKEEEAQYRWLEKELKKAKKANHIMLFCHIPFFIKDPDEPGLYYDKEKTEGENIERAERKKYLSLLEKYHVTAVFAGHLHRNNYGKYKGIEMVTTSAVGEPLGKDPKGLRIITVSKNKVTNQYYSLDSIPTHIDLTD